MLFTIFDCTMLSMKNILLPVLALLMVFSAHAWTLRKDKDGIRVYTEKRENSVVRAVKAECEVTATLSQIAALLSDVPRHHEWVYGIRSARLMQRTSQAEFIYYSEVSAPWPCSNRDFVVDTRMVQSAPGVLDIDSRTQPDLLPANPGIVRVKYSVSHWVLTMLGNNRVKVEYTIEFDPGGMVPPWVVNMFIADGPYKTFKNMRDQLPQYGYKDAHYDFIKE